MFFTTSSFNERVNSFEKPKIKKNYRSYLKDVKKSLSKFGSFEAAYNAHRFNLEIKGCVQIKHYVLDSYNSRGSKDGYRLIFLCIPDRDENGSIKKPITGNIYLQDVYPKRGDLHTENLTDDRFVELCEICFSDIAKGDVVPFPVP